jgi:hypothetical protein
MKLFRARETAELRDRLDKETRYLNRTVLVFCSFCLLYVLLLLLLNYSVASRGSCLRSILKVNHLMLFINGNSNTIMTSKKRQWGMKDRDKEGVAT